MKKSHFYYLTLILGALLLFGCCPNANAQTVQVELSDLPPEMQEQIKAQFETDAITKKIETYGKWAGMGKEIGIAAREGLGAVKDVTLEVADTKLGKTVIWLIVWKVAGMDIIGIFIGLLLIIIVTWVVIRSYFRSFSNRRLVEAKGFFLWRKRKYEPVDPNDNWGGCSQNRATAQIMHALVWLIVVCISFAVMFG